MNVKTSNGCPANSTGEDTNSSGSPSSNGTNGTASQLADEKPFGNNISALGRIESGHHNAVNGASSSTNSALAIGSNALDAGALTNDFNRASNSTLISLAARINSGFNSFYPGLHSDSYGLVFFVVPLQIFLFFRPDSIQCNQANGSPLWPRCHWRTIRRLQLGYSYNPPLWWAKNFKLSKIKLPFFFWRCNCYAGLKSGRKTESRSIFHRFLFSPNPLDTPKQLDQFRCMCVRFHRNRNVKCLFLPAEALLSSIMLE